MFEKYPPKRPKYEGNDKKRGFTIDKQNALKKRKQFCLVGIFEGFIEARICLENQNCGSPGGGGGSIDFFALGQDHLVLFGDAVKDGVVSEAFFSSVFSEAAFVSFEDFISGFRLRFDAVF